MSIRYLEREELVVCISVAAYLQPPRSVRSLRQHGNLQRQHLLSEEIRQDRLPK